LDAVVNDIIEVLGANIGMRDPLRERAEQRHYDADDDSGDKALYPSHPAAKVTLPFIEQGKNIDCNRDDGEKVGHSGVLIDFLAVSAHGFFKVHPKQGGQGENDAPFEFSRVFFHGG
jgi:hypothetical protein